VIFLFFAEIANAQGISIDTTRFVGGERNCGYSEARYSISTRDGGILLVGLTTCYSGGGDIPSNFANNGGLLNGNVLVVKLDAAMAISWVRVLGGTKFDCAFGAVQTGDGGFAVLATTESNDSDVSGNHGDEDVWLVNLDSLGTLRWQKCYGSAYDEQAVAISNTPDGGFVILGVSNGSGGDVPSHYSGSQFDYDWFVIKADSTGAIIWTKSIGGTNDESGYGAILSANGGYYLVSSTASTDFDCTDTAWHSGVNNQNDYYIFFLDSAGAIVWDSSYGGTANETAYTAIWDARDSTVVINGLTYSGDGFMVHGYLGSGDMWTIKVDRNGKLLWSKCLDSSHAEEGWGICTSQQGYIVYGSVENGMYGGKNCWFFVLNDTGKLLSDAQFGGGLYDEPRSIVGSGDRYFATGFTGSPFFVNSVSVGFLPGAMGDMFTTRLYILPELISTIQDVAPVSVLPNPALNELELHMPGEAGTLRILNCVGAQIVEMPTEASERIQMDVTQWTKGIYLVVWKALDGKTTVSKFVKM